MSTQSAACLMLLLVLCLAGSQAICDEQKGSEAAAAHSSLEAQHEAQQPQVARSISEARATVASTLNRQQEQQKWSGSSRQLAPQRPASDERMRSAESIGKSDGGETKPAPTAAEKAKQSAPTRKSTQQLDVNQEPVPVPTLIEHNQIKQEIGDKKLVVQLSPKEKSAVASPTAIDSPASLPEEAVGTLEKRLGEYQYPERVLATALDPRN